MNKKLIAEIFDSPEITEEISQFCTEFPEYRQAKENLNRWSAVLEQMLGYEQYCEFEDTLLKFCGLESQLGYLFGLRLRKELCAGLLTGAC